ncbi:MAG: tetratricopeptide repeat family protein, partial [Rhodoferax sp.]|nr:tetratricopeptide repeat family protein [Rhodoferax sp.]
MGPTIHLLGVPRVLRHDGTPVALRGRKAWGLLAFLLLGRESVSRQHLARLLFEDAEDPLAALRWNLTELRRALGQDSLRGDPLHIDRGALGPVDLDVLLRGNAQDGAQLPGLGHVLLEGLSFAGSPSFEVWIEAERRRIQSTAQAVLHEAALARLAAGANDEAVALASRLVALDPLDENAQVLLVRSLATAGDGIAAARQAATCRELFRRELGVLPGPALTDALHTATSAPIAHAATGRAGVIAQLDAGEAAIGAGVLDAGLQCLRRAIAEADLVGDPLLRTRARVALGGALVHAARGRDAEGAAALHEALAIGTEAAPGLAAAACRELGYVEFLLGRYERALAWLERADPLAGKDVTEHARIATLQGSVLSDRAYYDAALERLEHAGALCAEAGDARQRVYVDAMVGRVLLLTGRLDEACATLDHCIVQARSLWTAFLPWPQAFRAEIDLLQGRTDAAAERFAQAFALGCQLADPCWEGIARRGMGLVAAARGDTAGALAILLEALERCGRLPDAYVWASAYGLDALCHVAIAAQGGR